MLLADTRSLVAVARLNHMLHMQHLGLSSRWTYLLKTVPDIEDLLRPLDNVIHQTTHPSFDWKITCFSIETYLPSLLDKEVTRPLQPIKLIPSYKRCMDLIKGFSSWLSVLLLEQHGFYYT